jgi:F-type H+-transporting ATPase subunit epsilon
MTTLALEIVSPEKLLLSRQVEMVVIPAAEGELGVLPLHAPMIVLLRGGTIRIYENNQVAEQLYVDGGFAEITTTGCTVLASEAIPIADVSHEVGEQRYKTALAAYEAAEKTDVSALDTLMDQMQAAQALIDAAKRR